MFTASRNIKLVPLKLFTQLNSSVRIVNYHEIGRNYELTVASPTGLSSNEAKGVVFLLGWTGCVDKPLSKYSTIYQKMGFTVIRFSPLFSVLFSPQSLNTCQKHARKMVDLMYQESGAGKPVFIHSLSNAGGSFMRLLLDEFMDASKAKVSLKGCILDSAPSPYTLTTAYNGLIGVFPRFPGSELLAPIAASAFYPYIHFSIFFKYCVDWFTGERDTEYWRYLLWKHLCRQLDFHCPQLCLYSKADRIIEPKYIEMFVEERVKRGIKVQVRMFQDSSHVNHFRKYPVEYETAVEDFVQECLK